MSGCQYLTASHLSDSPTPTDGPDPSHRLYNSLPYKHAVFITMHYIVNIIDSSKVLENWNKIIFHCFINITINEEIPWLCFCFRCEYISSFNYFISFHRLFILHRNRAKGVQYHIARLLPRIDNIIIVLGSK